MKYDCPRMMDLLVDYMEGELTDDQQAHLEKHLSGCPPCTAFMSSYERAGEISRVALAREMPAEMKGKLLAFLREELEGG